MSSTIKTFEADAVLFDMDGTLTDSISAVEAAWGKVAKDIGQDPQHVIAATHGKRAVDNLAQFKPSIKKHEMDVEVQNFEESILYYADAYNTHGPGSRRNSASSSRRPSVHASRRPSVTANSALVDSGEITPELVMSTASGNSSRTTSISSLPPSRNGSMTAAHRPSFGAKLGSALKMSVVPETTPYVADEDPFAEDDEEEEEIDEAQLEREWEEWAQEKLRKHEWQAWQVEAAAIDRSVQILPGVKRMIDSLPKDRYAVATSGAKTYAYGCMTRVGIIPPEVTITADDKRLKAGKPAPDPFLLAAKCLGFNASNCVVFEDSPSGIKAGVASGATVIAVCTSHERSKIENCGAHYIVENMERVKVEQGENGKLLFSIDMS